MTNEERRAWLKNVKVGDEVADEHPSCPNTALVCVVTEVNRSTIVCDGLRRFSRTDGLSRPNKIRRVVPVSAIVREEKDRFDCIDALRDRANNIRHTPIATVRKLLAVLAEADKQGEERG